MLLRVPLRNEIKSFQVTSESLQNGIITIVSADEIFCCESLPHFPLPPETPHCTGYLCPRQQASKSFPENQAKSIPTGRSMAGGYTGRVKMSHRDRS